MSFTGSLKQVIFLLKFQELLASKEQKSHEYSVKSGNISSIIEQILSEIRKTQEKMSLNFQFFENSGTFGTENS